MARGKLHTPTDESRTTVERLKACALTHAQIAYVLEIDSDTLEKHYPRELKDGKGKIVLLLPGN